MRRNFTNDEEWPQAAFGARRRNAIAEAFGAIDRTRTGAVNATVVVNAYRAAQHPEVLAGRMSEEAARAEFLDTFECGGEAEGLVTLDEFLRYHILLPIEDDNYFELLLRNTWGLHEFNPEPSSSPSPSGSAPTTSTPPAPPPPPPELMWPPNTAEAAPSMPSAQDLEQPAGKSHRQMHDAATFGLPLTSIRQPPVMPPAQVPERHFNDAFTRDPGGFPRPRREVLGRGERKLAELPRHLQSCLAVTGHAISESTA